MPVEPGSCSPWPAGWVLIQAWIHHPVPGSYRLSLLIRLPGRVSPGKCGSGPFRKACDRADPAETFQHCSESLTEKAELSMHTAGPQFEGKFLLWHWGRSRQAWHVHCGPGNWAEGTLAR